VKDQERKRRGLATGRDSKEGKMETLGGNRACKIFALRIKTKKEEKREGTDRGTNIGWNIKDEKPIGIWGQQHVGAELNTVKEKEVNEARQTRKRERKDFTKRLESFQEKGGDRGAYSHPWGGKDQSMAFA